MDLAYYGLEAASPRESGLHVSGMDHSCNQHGTGEHHFLAILVWITHGTVGLGTGEHHFLAILVWITFWLPWCGSLLGQ